MDVEQIFSSAPCTARKVPEFLDAVHLSCAAYIGHRTASPMTGRENWTGLARVNSTPLDSSTKLALGAPFVFPAFAFFSLSLRASAASEAYPCGDSHGAGRRAGATLLCSTIDSNHALMKRGRRPLQVGRLATNRRGAHAPGPLTPLRTACRRRDRRRRSCLLEQR